VYGYIQDLKKDYTRLILSGDYNICHKAIDIHNPISNKNTSGFLPEERAWMDKFVELGFIDTFREYNTDTGHYSWWSYRAGSRAKNLGWRIDYHMASKELQNKLKSAAILPDVVHSDHCPIVLELH
jgi:exodeoxyribonuclease-3